MISLRHKIGESIELTVDGKKIIITLHDVSQGAARLELKADEGVDISHRVLPMDFED